MTNFQLGDLNYVEVRARTYKVPTCVDPQPCIVSQLPLHGSGWYPELICRHSLSTGLITWNDIKLTYRATGRIKLSAVQEVLDIMESSWGGDELNKKSWNSAVGIMSTEFSQIARVVTKENELPSYGTKLATYTFKGKNGEDMKLYDWITTVPTVSCFSYRPLWDCIIAWEHVKTTCLILALERNAQIDKRNILQLKTDAVLVDGGKRGKKRKALEEVKNMTYEQVGRLSNHPLGPCTYPVRVGDKGLIYQAGTAKKLRGQKYDKVRRNTELLTLTKTWTDVPLMIGEKYDFTELFRHILDGKNIGLDGMPGGGKTTVGQQLVEMLRRAGKKIQVIGKTNVCLERFGEGQTADKWLFIHVTKGLGAMPDVLFVEEISLIGLNLWTSICTAFMSGRLKKIQVILCGDLFQLQPPRFAHCGVPIAKHTLRDSDLFYQLTGGFKCFLDRNMRSCPVIYAFARTLRLPDADLHERLAHAKTLFKATDRTPDTVLVLSNEKRIRFNKEVNEMKKRELERPEDAVLLQLTGARCKDECLPQSFWVWPGIVVLGHQKPCKKGMMYEVESITGETLLLKAVMNARANGETPVGATVKVPKSVATDAFRPSHAVTYCRSQGLTLRGLIVLADVSSCNFQIEHLNLGVTRATDSTLVEIRDC